MDARSGRMLGLGVLVSLVLAGLMGSALLRERPVEAPSTAAEAPAAAGPADASPVPGTAAAADTDPTGDRDPAGDRGPAGDRDPAGDPDPADYPAPPAATDPASATVATSFTASPRERSPVSPVPASERVRKPDAVRGIYVGSWSVGNASRLDSFIRLAEETEVNAFVVDIKEALGEVSHRTRVPAAREVGADRNPAIADLRGVVAQLREHGIYPIARIVVFKDPLLAQARPQWSIRRTDGSLWVDNRGVHWVDPFNRDVWDYNIELAREAVALGFSEIQWDYVRFPDVPGSYLREAVYPAREGRTMAAGIREFLIYSRERLDMPDVPQTADVFGVTTSAFTDVGIGQLWEKMADVTDVLLPMVYPSHYPRGTWGYPVPNAEPYEIVRKALGHGVNRSAAIENAATIRPWLQAFTLGDPPYGPAEIREQIRAVYDSGLTEWILWSPSARYPRDAFLPR